VILFADLMLTIGAIVMAIAREIAVLILGRVLVGIGVGIVA